MTRKNQKSSSEFPQMNSRQIKRRKPINLDFMRTIEPLTENQKRLVDFYNQDKNIFAHGVPGSGKTMLLLYNALKEVLNEKSVYDKIYIIRSLIQTRSIGFMPGPQPLDAKILTPNGWTTMGSLKVGDYVIGRNGKPTKVLGVYPKGKKLVYKITTTENTSTECCEDHLWLTKTFEDKKRKRVGSVKSTKEIINTLYNKEDKPNHYIPRNEPVHFNKNELPIPPYTMGVILGDGSIGNNICIYNKDDELIQKVNEELSSIDCEINKCNFPGSIQYLIKQKNIKSKKTAKKIILNNLNKSEILEYQTVGDAIKCLNLSQSTIYDRCKSDKVFNNVKYSFGETNQKWSNPVKNYLYELGLENKKSHTKFIPEIYKYSSIEDRIELLRGLMDSDGTIKDKQKSKSCFCSFTTTSKQLAEDVVELVQSLGGRSTYWIRDRRGHSGSIVPTPNGDKKIIKNRLICYDLSISLPKDINPFFISRKSSRFDPKYITHIGIKSITPVCEKEVQCILVEDPEHLYITDQYIVTHNTEDDKKSLFEIPYKNMVKYMFEMPDDPSFDMLYSNLKAQGTIKFWCTSFIRGVTLDNSIIIVDEAQNLTAHECFSVISRCGLNTKIMFAGDVEQSDLTKIHEKNGIIDFMRIIDVMPSFERVEFEIDDIVRSPLVREFMIAKKTLGL